MKLTNLRQEDFWTIVEIVHCESSHLIVYDDCLHRNAALWREKSLPKRLTIFQLAVPSVFGSGVIEGLLANGKTALKSNSIDLLENVVGGLRVVAVVRLQAALFSVRESQVMESDMIVDNHWELDTTAGAEVVPG